MAPRRQDCTAPARALSRGDEAVAPYPTCIAYFDALPDGWASFPACVARASLVGSLRDRGALALDALPSPLRPLLDHLSTDAEWLPEVVLVAFLLAVHDARFGDSPRADDDFLGWMTQLNRDLLGEPEHASELRVANPGDLVPRLPALWKTFHVGTPMTVEHSATHARVVLAHPRQLFPALLLECHRRTLALSLAKAGAAQLHVEARTEVSADEALTVFEASWR